MATKPKGYRFYTSDRSAKLRSGDRTLILKKNDQFQLLRYKDQICVVKDGVVYAVNPKLVAELKSRSKPASVAKEYSERAGLLDVYGIDVEKALIKNLKSLVSSLDGTDVLHWFENGKVSLSFNTVAFERPESVRVEFAMTEFSITASMFVSDVASVEGWPGVPLVEKAYRMFLKYLVSKVSITRSKIVKRTATIAGVHVAKKPFRGKVVYFSVSWNPS